MSRRMLALVLGLCFAILWNLAMMFYENRQLARQNEIYSLGEEQQDKRDNYLER